MATQIQIKRGSTTPAGLTVGESAMNTSTNQIYLGGTGGTVLVGGEVTGGVDMGAGSAVSANRIPTQSGVYNYVRNSTVTSFNGLTGAVGGVCAAQANTFTALNSFNAGISASGATFSGDIAVNGGDITTTSTTATVFNTTATNLSIGSAATTWTVGATSGTATIRNPNVVLGNSTSTILTTPASATNSLFISPNGNLALTPSTNAPSVGTFPSVLVENTSSAAGQVKIAGGDLYLGVKSTNDEDYIGVNLIFEGSTDNANDTTLTVVDPTATRTITLPDASGTVALTNSVVTSFNGATGAVTGITAGGANTFTALNTFSAGISAAGTTAATFNGTVDMNFNTLYEPTLRYYNEVLASPAITANALTLDLTTAQMFTVSLNANITTFTISNTPATANRSIGFTLIFTADGTARTVTWGSAVKWANNDPPALTSTNGKKDILSFVSPDGGTNWYGFIGGLNF